MNDIGRSGFYALMGILTPRPLRVGRCVLRLPPRFLRPDGHSHAAALLTKIGRPAFGPGFYALMGILTPRPVSSAASSSSSSASSSASFLRPDGHSHAAAPNASATTSLKTTTFLRPDGHSHAAAPAIPEQGTCVVSSFYALMGILTPRREVNYHHRATSYGCFYALMGILTPRPRPRHAPLLKDHTRFLRPDGHSHAAAGNGKKETTQPPQVSTP